MFRSPRLNERHRIFISSTDDPETKKYRIAAREVMEEEEFSDRWFAVEMSQFTASKSPPIEECRRQVLECAVYIGLLGPFYGSVNEQTGLSYTEFEYTVAKNAPRELGVFLLPEQSIIEATDYKYLLENGRNFERQQELRKRVSQEHMIVTIRTGVDEFKTQLRRFLHVLSQKTITQPTLTPVDQERIGQIVEISEPNSKTIEEKSYPNHRGAFADLERHMHNLLKGQIDKGIARPQMYLKLLAVAMTFSWDDVITTRVYPDLLKAFPSAIVNLDILFVDPDYLEGMSLASYPTNWVFKSRQRLDETQLFVKHIEADLIDNLRVNAKTYRNLPHWHGWLINEDFLFLGRTTWDFSHRQQARMYVGQSKYRYFDRTTDQGKERIKLFGDWFYYYWNFSSQLIVSNYSPEGTEPGV